MCIKLDNCCFCLSLNTGTKITSIFFTATSAFAVLVYAPLALLSDSLPPARFYFYCCLAVLAVLEVVIGGLLIHGAFKNKPQYTWPWLILAWWKGIILIFLTIAGMVAVVVSGNVELIAETCPVISTYFLYAILLLYLACVVNSRRQEQTLEIYWAEKHVLQHVKTHYYYL